MNRKFSLVLATFAIAGLLSLGVSSASGALYSFYKLTNNNVEDLSSQLSVDVTGAGSQASFKFYNSVGTASSITDIYFDDGTLLGISSITDSGAGVAFDDPANPANLPSGNTASPPFTTTQNFSADSDAPVMANGVSSSSEWVMITFDLINGKTITDTIAALDDGSLRIGLHVQAIGVAGGSDSYINLPNDDNDDQTVPEPMSLAIWGLGLGCLGLVGMRRRKV